jgi:hypothetical protein
VLKKRYENRTDLEKIQSQWNKLTGLHSRDEASAAIVRAATAAEIAANFAVRTEFALRSNLSSDFVDSLLRWANGLDGKISRLLLTISEGSRRHKTFVKLKGNVEQINRKRNAIGHQGEFCNLRESEEIIEKTRHFIETVVRMYEPRFKLKDTNHLPLLIASLKPQGFQEKVGK